MKRVKEILLMGILSSVMLLATGCWDMVEINDRLCVRGIGLDAGTKPDQLKVTFQMLTPYESSDTQGQPVYQTLTVEAATVSEAVAQLAVNVEQQVHFEHLSAIVLGSALAQQDPIPLLDYFHRTSQVRRNAEVVAVEGEAQKLMAGSVAGGGVGEYVENLIKSHETENIFSVQPSALSRLFVCRANQESFYLPLLAYQPPEDDSSGQTSNSGSGQQKNSEGSSQEGKPSDAQSLKLIGAYLYDGTHFAGVMDADQLELLRMLQGMQEHITLTLHGAEDPSQRMAFRVEHMKMTLSTEACGDHWVFPVFIEAECVFQESLGENTQTTEALYPQMEQALQVHIAEKTDALIVHTRNTGTDVLGFGRQLRQKRHRWYQENAAQWPSCFLAAQIPIEVHVTLRRGGYLQ